MWKDIILTRLHATTVYLIIYMFIKIQELLRSAVCPLTALESSAGDLYASGKNLWGWTLI